MMLYEATPGGLTGLLTVDMTIHKIVLLGGDNIYSYHE